MKNIMEDKKIGLKAQALFLHIKDMLENGERINTEKLVAKTGEGKGAINSAIKKLIAEGYIKRSREREGNLLTYIKYEIIEEETTKEETTKEENTKEVEEKQEAKNGAISKYRKKIDETKKQFKYNELLKECKTKAQKGILKIILEITTNVYAYCSDKFKINGVYVDGDTVREKIKMLNKNSIKSAIFSILKHINNVRNIKAYIITTLYNVSFSCEKISIEDKEAIEKESNKRSNRRSNRKNTFSNYNHKESDYEIMKVIERRSLGEWTSDDKINEIKKNYPKDHYVWRLL